MPRVAIFLCDDNTFAECTTLQLFGTNEPYGLTVHTGDFCLLYHYSHNHVYGIWRATTNGGNHVAQAWHGQFPNQIRVMQVGDEITGMAKNQIQPLIGFQIIGKVYEGVQAENLLSQFRQSAQRQIADLEKPASAPQPSPQIERRVAQQLGQDYLLPPRFFCSDGDRVRSQGEKIIDDWLHGHGVRHKYEPAIEIIGGQIIPDFVVYSRSGAPIYIEYWGLLNEPNYDQRRREKTRLYAQNNLSLIQIVPDDLQVIDYVLKKELERWDVPFGKPGLFERIALLIRRIFNRLTHPD
jgi:hypothetical protein